MYNALHFWTYKVLLYILLQPQLNKYICISLYALSMYLLYISITLYLLYITHSISTLHLFYAYAVPTLYTYSIYPLYTSNYIHTCSIPTLYLFYVWVIKKIFRQVKHCWVIFKKVKKKLYILHKYVLIASSIRKNFSFQVIIILNKLVSKERNFLLLKLVLLLYNSLHPKQLCYKTRSSLPFLQNPLHFRHVFS